MTRYHTPVGAALAPPTPAACPEPAEGATLTLLNTACAPSRFAPSPLPSPKSLSSAPTSTASPFAATRPPLPPSPSPPGSGHLHALHTPGPRGPLPPPPPLNYRAVRLLARHLAHQTIKEQGLAPIREAPKTPTSVEQSNAAPGLPPLALSPLPTPWLPPRPASPPPRRQSGASYRSHRG